MVNLNGAAKTDSGYKRKHRGFIYVIQNLDLYMIMIPGLLSLIIFNYLPMFGLAIAFTDFNFANVFKSPWAGLKNFEIILSSPKFFSVLSNTLLINFYKLVFEFPLPIILAILIYEIKNVKFKRGIQTVTYIPHFLSWVVIAAIFTDILSPDTGIINYFIKMLGMKPVFFMADNRFFRGVLVLSSAWKETGWNSILYLAAMASIDTELFDAAEVDGAGKFKRILHIIIPGISSTIIFLVMLRLGNAISSKDLEQVLMMYSPLVYDVGDVISTYVYRQGIFQAKYSFSTAVGLIQSVVGFVMIYTANCISRKFGDRGLW